MENEEVLIAWIAGLFEGEGTFVISNGVSKGLSITSTDKDVLLRVQEVFGGSIYSNSKRKEHHKDPFVWSIRSKNSVEVYLKIEKYLLKRRKKRGEEWLASQPHKAEEKSRVLKQKKLIMEDMFKDQRTHQEIADFLKVDRTAVSHHLRKVGLRRLFKKK